MPIKHQSSLSICVLILTLYVASFAGAQTANEAVTNEPLVLSAEKLQDGFEELDEAAWVYRMGDDGRWAANDYDDSAWSLTGFDDAVLSPDNARDERWRGAAWFRLRLQVDENLVGQPLALRMRHWGASEIYIDGKLIKRFGVIEADRDVEFNPRALPVPFVFTESGSHTIAIRYSYKAAGDLSSGIGRWLVVRAGMEPGFDAFVQPADTAIASYARMIREVHNNRLFAGILATLALIHFLLYVFYRRERANLFYTLFALSLAAAVMITNEGFNRDNLNGANSAFAASLFFVAFIATFAVVFMSLLAFLYVAFAEKFGKPFYLLLALWVVLVSLTALFVRQNLTLYVACLSFTLTLIEGIRIMVRALVARRAGAWIIMAGLLLFTTGMCIEMSGELIGFSRSGWLGEIKDFFILLAVPVAVSIFLARNFARTNTNLETQLLQVRDLSAKQLEHERTEAGLRVQHEKMRAESERRAKELEEARQLQLSMLPKRVPQLPHLEIAAYMKPATEVGGDYYDFHVGTDGTLTVVVGDATGHGLKAGTVVTATKSLFNAFASEPDIRTFFRQSSRALKGMNLRGLYMAMGMMKIRGNKVEVSFAGIPPLLIYRYAENCVEELAIGGMPLGSIETFPYKQHELELCTGDALVLMSDGFPERFDERGEMLGYGKAREVLREVAGGSAQEVINRFVAVGDEWAGARAQDDDVTFVVVKMP